MENRNVEIEVKSYSDEAFDYRQFQILITRKILSSQEYHDRGCPFCGGTETREWRSTGVTTIYECKPCRKTFFVSSSNSSEIGIEQHTEPATPIYPAIPEKDDRGW